MSTTSAPNSAETSSVGNSHAPDAAVADARAAEQPLPPTRPARSRLVMISATVVAIVLLLAYVTFSWSGDDEHLKFYAVVKSDLPITVTERGTLQSQENVEIRCDVDEVGREGTPIVWLIDNGASVKKGDLIVELATGSHQSVLDQQILDTEQALSAQIQAKAKYDNQITQNETTLANAELQVTLADLEMQMFSDKESGTHQLEVEEIKRLIDDINNEILASRTSMELSKNDRDGIETLFKLGYAGKSEVNRSHLEYLQAESQYAAKMNKLTTQLATLKKKETYEQEMQVLKLAGGLETAKRNRDQVKRDNEALLEQAKAAWNAAERSLVKEQERLERAKKQVANCKVYAPRDGMVTYAVSDPRRWWEGEIRVGGTVRERQHIMSIPNLTRMEVTTSINESILDKVTPDLPATIRVEALSGRSFPGKVRMVSVMANQQASGVKDYTTVVTLDNEVTDLKPGMTAVVDIHIARLKSVLPIPVQAIMQDEEATWCYVKSGQGTVKRKIKLGHSNDKFVEIREGLTVNEQVVLNPIVLLERELAAR